MRDIVTLQTYNTEFFCAQQYCILLLTKLLGLSYNTLLV